MNKYVWELYLKNGGRKTVKFFEDNLCNEMSEDYVEGIRKFQEVYCVSQILIDDTEFTLGDFINSINEDDEIEYEHNSGQEYKDAIDEIMNEIWYFLKAETLSDKEAFSVFVSEAGGIRKLVQLSTSLAIDCPEYFIPYYFQCNYNVVESIAEKFDIELPKLPNKTDYKGRFFHYGELCKVFTQYRLDNGWSPYELFAFLYDFAPKYIGGIDSYIIQDLPEPQSAFFIGGGGDNEDAVAEDDSDSIDYWQCNPETRAGDMIVMYLRSPISSISSIWRSCSIGFNDPFFFYYRCTYIGSPCKVKRLGISQIKKDKVLSQLPIVKKNMQGINGEELKPSEYNYIVDKVKGNVPKLEFEDISVDNSYINEKDVENRCIKPFLSRLGYNEDDYIQQLYVPIGNHNNTLIPDFVLLPETFRGKRTAFAIIEAKKSISNDKELSAALEQVRSYALLLSATYAVLASQEGIWISSKDNGYIDLEKYSWDELSDNDNMYMVNKLIGKR